MFRLGTAEAIAVGREDTGWSTDVAPPLHADAVVGRVDARPVGGRGIRCAAGVPRLPRRAAGRDVALVRARSPHRERDRHRPVAAVGAADAAPARGHVAAARRALRARRQHAARRRRPRGPRGERHRLAVARPDAARRCTCTRSPARSACRRGTSTCGTSPSRRRARSRCSSDESLDLRWFAWDALPEGVAPDLPRLVEARTRPSRHDDALRCRSRAVDVLAGRQRGGRGGRAGRRARDGRRHVAHVPARLGDETAGSAGDSRRGRGGGGVARRPGGRVGRARRDVAAPAGPRVRARAGAADEGGAGGDAADLLERRHRARRAGWSSRRPAMRFSAYLDEALEPLDLAGTSLPGSPARDGVSTVDDLARVAQELLSPTGLLAPSTLEDLRTVQYPGPARRAARLRREGPQRLGPRLRDPRRQVPALDRRDELAGHLRALRPERHDALDRPRRVGWRWSRSPTATSDPGPPTPGPPCPTRCSPTRRRYTARCSRTTR